MFYNGFPSIEKSWLCCCLSFHLLSNKLKTGCPFHRIAYDYSCTDWDCLRDHLRDVPWDDIFKPSAPAAAAASEFCEWVQVGIDVNIPHRKLQIKTHSSQWFSAPSATAIVQRNHFFPLHQQNKCSESNVKFWQASDHCKRVLEAAKPSWTTKTKSTSLHRNLALRTFGELLIVFSAKVNLL